MKKILAIIVCLSTLLAMALCINASVTPAVECKVSATQIKLGETITVSVVLKDCPMVKTIGITPLYDGGVFELVEAKWTVEGALIADFNKTTGDGVAAFAEDRHCNTDIFTFKLKAKTVPVFGDSSISAKAVLQNSDYNGNISNSSITTTVKVTPLVEDTKPATTVTTPATDPVTTPKETDPTSNYDTIESTTEPIDETTSPSTEETVADSETTGETSVDESKTPEQTDEVNDDTSNDKSKNTVIIVVASVVGILAIAALVYTNYKNRR